MCYVFKELTPNEMGSKMKMTDYPPPNHHERVHFPLATLQHVQSEIFNLTLAAFVFAHSLLGTLTIVFLFKKGSTIDHPGKYLLGRTLLDICQLF